MMKSFFFLCIIGLFSNLYAQDIDLKPLNHDDYDSWEKISDYGVSDDGKYAFASITPQVGDGVSILFNLETGDEIVRLERAFQLSFLPNTGFLVFSVKPVFEKLRQQKLRKVKSENILKNEFVIGSISKGKFEILDSLGPITSYKIDFGRRDTFVDIFGIQRPSKRKENPSLSIFSVSQPVTFPVALQTEQSFKLDTLGEWRNVLKWGFPENKLYESGFYLIIENSETKNQELLFNPMESDSLYDKGADFGSIVFGKNKNKRYQNSIFYLKKNKTEDTFSSIWFAGSDKRQQHFRTLIVELNAPGLSPGSFPSFNGGLTVENTGLFFYYELAFRPVQWDDSLTLKEERSNLDIWSWNDDLIQPQQAKKNRWEKSPRYMAFFSFMDSSIVKLSDKSFSNAIALNDNDWVIRYSQNKYKRQYSYDVQLPYDLELISKKNGNILKIGEAMKIARSPQMNPSGNAIAYYLSAKRHWEIAIVDSSSSKKVSIKKMKVPIPKPVWNEDHDSPSYPYPYGSPGWLSNGDFVVYDAYDIWSYNLRTNEVKNLTNFQGRNSKTRMRILNLEPKIGSDLKKKVGVDNRDKSITVRAFNTQTKSSGFHKIDMLTGDSKVISQGESKHSRYLRAKDADTYLFTKETIRSSPNLFYFSFLDSSNLETQDYLKKQNNAFQLTDINLQQDSFVWPKVEMINYRAFGQKLQGLLYTPSASSIGEKLPMIIYFYERYSDRFHDYKTPAPSASTINVSWFVSNGYAVFIPDIIYKVGRPGESALKCINKGVDQVLKIEKRIDPKRMGLQGQSWGGYQTAFLITRTNRYACAMAGAPVSNMFSAYGGIRYSSGMSRQFQYEKTQSRIGKTPWKGFYSYKKNSPVFYANKVNTPLLIMHNDNDGAVPFTQGVELFMGLRRLEKPVWMLVYNGEQHNLRKRANRLDLSIRMSEFFDYYLKNSLKPDWMAKGRSLKEKPTEK